MRSSTSWVVASEPGRLQHEHPVLGGPQHVQLAVGADVVDARRWCGCRRGRSGPRRGGGPGSRSRECLGCSELGRMVARADRRPRGQGGMMTVEITEHDDVAGHVSTGQLPTPDDRASVDRGRLRAVSGSARRHGRQLHPGAGLGESRPVRRDGRRRQRRTCTRWATPADSFTIQSISKAFVFALVLEAIGADEARRRLGVNSTGLPFNSVMAIELQRATARRTRW